MSLFSNINLTVLALAISLAGLVIADAAIYLQVPRDRHPLRWLFGINVIVLVIFNTGLLLAVNSLVQALTSILIMDSIAIAVFLVVLRAYKRQTLLSSFTKRPEYRQQIEEFHRIVDGKLRSLLAEFTQRRDLPPLEQSVGFLLDRVERLNLVLDTKNGRAFRMSVLQPTSAGGFQVIAAANVSQEKIDVVEAQFRWLPPIVGLAGHCAANMLPILSSDLTVAEEPFSQYYVDVRPSPQKIKGGGILCIPVLDPTSHGGVLDRCLAILAITCLEPGFLTPTHEVFFTEIVEVKFAQVFLLYRSVTRGRLPTKKMAKPTA